MMYKMTVYTKSDNSCQKHMYAMTRSYKSYPLEDWTSHNLNFSLSPNEFGQQVDLRFKVLKSIFNTIKLADGILLVY